MNIFQFLFLTCFKICTCFDISIFRYEIDLEETIEDYPFTVIIVENEPTKKVNSFGTLIHERAVLAYQSQDTDKQSYFNFKACAGCSLIKNNRRRNAFNCSQNRSITEYNIIDLYDKMYSYLNMVILVLSEPFELNKRVHQVELAYSPEDYDPINCRILYYMLLKNSNTSNSNRFTYPAEIQYIEGLTDLLVDTSEIERTYGHQKTELFGSPVICKSKIQDADWFQIFLSFVTLDPTAMSSFELFAHHISPYYQIFEETLYHSGFFNNLQFFDNDKK
ncbi:uncharacterized protein [Chelonus insularis]|uniref:uncharacterized protein n=1 Tax=Chelonus insularis TaxID=460826 RepID=UPI0015886918|nr:uncharacterized protein LOC118072065 [Chelonus insularis]